MFDYRRIALWIAVILIPGGFLLLPLLFAELRKHRNAQKAAADMAENDAKTPNDGPGSRPHTPHDGTTPPLAA